MQIPGLKKCHIDIMFHVLNILVWDKGSEACLTTLERVEKGSGFKKTEHPPPTPSPSEKYYTKFGKMCEWIRQQKLWECLYSNCWD